MYSVLACLHCTHRQAMPGLPYRARVPWGAGSRCMAQIVRPELHGCKPRNQRLHVVPVAWFPPGPLAAQEADNDGHQGEHRHARRVAEVAHCSVAFSRARAAARLDLNESGSLRSGRSWPAKDRGLGGGALFEAPPIEVRSTSCARSLCALPVRAPLPTSARSISAPVRAPVRALNGSRARSRFAAASRASRSARLEGIATVRLANV